MGEIQREGALYGIKRGLSCRVEFIKIGEVDLVLINTNGSKFYVLPTYLNCSQWEQDFFNFSEFLTKFSYLDFLVVEVLNARIGLIQELNPEILNDFNKFDYLRNSKDTIVNTRGKKFIELCDELGLIVLNGRSLGDREGHLTFVGARRSSVIDFSCGSVHILPLIDDFSVKSEIFSDHLPIVFSILTAEPRERIFPLLPQL